MANRSIEFDFLGEKISLKVPAPSEGSSSDILNEVIALAQYKIKDAQKRARGAASHKIVLLALLDLAEDYVQSKTKTTEFKREVSQKSQTLIQLLDAELSH